MSVAAKNSGLPDLPCACVAIRQAARLVTQFYGEELRGHLEAPQFGLLSAIERRPGSNQASLARALDLDKTTLSRNLKWMEKQAWIERAASDDRRERGYHLTEVGRKLLRAARPRWKRAQTRLQSAMTGEQWDAMWQALETLRTAVGEARARRDG